MWYDDVRLTNGWFYIWFYQFLGECLNQGHLTSDHGPWVLVSRCMRYFIVCFDVFWRYACIYACLLFLLRLGSALGRCLGTFIGQPGHGQENEQYDVMCYGDVMLEKVWYFIWFNLFSGECMNQGFTVVGGWVWSVLIFLWFYKPSGARTWESRIQWIKIGFSVCVLWRCL